MLLPPGLYVVQFPVDRADAPPGDDRGTEGSTMFNLDFSGFVTSTEFLAQLAALISGLLSALLGQFFAGLFTPSA